MKRITITFKAPQTREWVTRYGEQSDYYRAMWAARGINRQIAWEYAPSISMTMTVKQRDNYYNNPVK